MHPVSPKLVNFKDSIQRKGPIWAGDSRRGDVHEVAGIEKDEIVAGVDGKLEGLVVRVYIPSPFERV